MPDVFTKKKRSQIMSRIRAKNTGLEKAVFSYLRKQGVYFRKHYDRVPGKPDIAIPSKKIAVFINGDFWHGYKFSEWKNRMPAIYWREKIQSNIDRDKKSKRQLKRMGWKILSIWGHEIKEKPERTLKRIADFLRNGYGG